MKITVVGTGYVGLVTGVCLSEVDTGYVTCLDIDSYKIGQLKKGISPIYENDLEDLINKNIKKGTLEFTTDYKSAYKDKDIIILAVGTPPKDDGSANLEYLFKACDEIIETISKDILIVVKSTVPIGTCTMLEKYINDKLNNGISVEVASNPEFLAQGSAVKDTLYASRIVIGVNSKHAKDLLENLYKNFNIPIVCVSRESSEMIKYASNSFLALKISYINDIANLCEKVGANIQDVVKGMQYDERIGDKFLNAGIGYGGSCFPKDTKALYSLANKYNYDLKTVKATIDVNEYQKLRLIENAKEIVGSFKNLEVAILGVTFKPGTDDLRDAPSIPNIKYLLEHGAKVRIYDPVGLNNYKKLYKENNVVYTENIDECIKGTHLCLIMTEWSEIVNYDLEKYKKLMKTPIVLDGRNCYKISKIRDMGIEYYSIGR